MNHNLQLCLKHRPRKELRPHNFHLREVEIPELRIGQFLVRNEYISVDPAMRGWTKDRESYFAPVQIGDPMRALAVGTIVASRHPSYFVGEMVTGMFNLQAYAVSDGFQVRKIDIELAPAPTWLGGLGMPGVTAYFGLLDIGRPEAGETVLVSAAAGAVGAIVGQIAKNIGCRVVGIVGSEEKRKYVVETLGFDNAINYKDGRIEDQLRELCPRKIDIYFDNVAGKTLDSVLPFMNRFGRIPLCGVISCSEGRATKMSNISSLLVNRICLRGFIMSDYISQLYDAVDQLLRWYKSGQILFKEDVRLAPLEAFPVMLDDLFNGRNFGKLVMKLEN